MQCLTEWTSVSRSCPIDRLPFTSYHVVDRCAEGAAVDESSVSARRANYVTRETIAIATPESNIETDAEDDNNDNDTCAICQQRVPGSTLVLCDVCNLGHHLSCAFLSRVPRANWLCDPCRAALVAQRAASRAPLSTANSLHSRVARERSTIQHLRQSRANRLITQHSMESLSRLPFSSQRHAPDDLEPDPIIVFLKSHRTPGWNFRESVSAVESAGNRVGSVMRLEESFKRKQEQDQRLEEERNRAVQAQKRKQDEEEALWAQFKTAKKVNRNESSLTRNLSSSSSSSISTAAVAAPQLKTRVPSNISEGKGKRPLHHLPSDLEASESHASSVIPSAKGKERAIDPSFIPIPSSSTLHSRIPSSSSTSSTTSNLAASSPISTATTVSAKPPNIKARIATVVKGILDPMFKSNRISKDQYKYIAKDATSTIFQELTGGREDGEVIDFDNLKVDTLRVKDISPPISTTPSPYTF
ncbi:hypothetical protein BCR33DRAFT_784945 [Rhizoclosmatium globosum]|uniref:PHD-type domain-containing protein n=1 Tax=Rhizoclosmatium globosum TaxID=329046 RepID=A0A1Y2CF15_9FUNG|nr:hypothetical protein BCR33DRAFT_784945 [Rhizoclosmatium globosum]|eukprot:ORY44895.1 hypothetical protein BCR33DRAFT_784945 [Rhizoclosmatium globosum]